MSSCPSSRRSAERQENASRARHLTSSLPASVKISSRNPGLMFSLVRPRASHGSSLITLWRSVTLRCLQRHISGLVSKSSAALRDMPWMIQSPIQLTCAQLLRCPSSVPQGRCQLLSEWAISKRLSSSHVQSTELSEIVLQKIWMQEERILSLD